MSVFKCKMCGGTLEIREGQSTVVCDYCGIAQTLPKMDSDKKNNLLTLAKECFENYEYDQAMTHYEEILSEDISDAEVYWSLVLCTYGVQYEVDPDSKERKTTVNRLQYTSIFDNRNYKAAIKYADSYQREIYEREAAELNEIQKEILAISQREPPYDVFISYKDKDNGMRTDDSTKAEALYHKLTEAGMNVFFSRITMKKHVGQAFEPIIFAALNSAKVMVVMGSKPEYFQAAWVRNEWSRYLALVKVSQGKKTLIPVCLGMSPEKLPIEFNNLHARDGLATGFNEDLTRGIQTLVDFYDPKPKVQEVIVTGVQAGIDSMLKRAYLCLEDGEFGKAAQLCEQVLNQDAENALAYVGELMAEKKCRTREDLQKLRESFEDSKHYQKAMRFADSALRQELKGYLENIRKQQEINRKDEILFRARTILDNATRGEEYDKIRELLAQIPGWRDSDQVQAEADEKYRIQEIRRKDRLLEEAQEAYQTDDVYQILDGIKKLEQISGWKHADELRVACDKKLDELEIQLKDEILQAGKEQEQGGTKLDLQHAIEVYEKVKGWKDADERIIACKKKIAQLEEKERQEEERRYREYKARKRRNRILRLAFLAICVIAYLAVTNVVIPAMEYKEAVSLYEDGYYAEAILLFGELEGYKDSEEYAAKALPHLEVGDTFAFGSYKGSRLLPGKIFSAVKFYKNEPIVWRILEKRDGKFFVVAEKCIDGKQHNDGEKFVPWNESALYRWLDVEFTRSAFTEAEREQIVQQNGQNKVFLLTSAEAKTYFADNDARKTKATDYASDQMGYEDIEEERTVYWWLSDAARANDPAFVSKFGEVDGYGTSSYRDTLGVRPALWIRFSEETLEAEKQEPYQQAVAAYEAGNYHEAMEIFVTMMDYEDAGEYYQKALTARLAECQEGDTIILGKYQQDFGGESAITWTVLSREEDRVLLFSEKCLTVKAYHDTGEEVTWEMSSLRSWLNGDFYENAFHETEKEKIQEVNNENGKTNATLDRVFILSAGEIKTYLPDMEDRVPVLSEYAQSADGKIAYWLRGDKQDDYMKYINSKGDYTHPYYEKVDSTTMCVRPALWIQIGEEASAMRNQSQYEQAVALYEAGNYAEAAPLLGSLTEEDAKGYYKDSMEKWLDACQVGDSIFLGRYLQEKEIPEPISWRVLAKDGDAVLLISEKCLDARPSHTVWKEKTTWEISELRSWLNNEFYSSAFQEWEQSWINEVTLVNEGANDTQDRVFILNKEELQAYMPDQKSREAHLTTYAQEQGGKSWYWARTAVAERQARCVHEDGDYENSGWKNDKATVRPALWIQIR